MQSLLPEIIEEILTIHVDAHSDTDPAHNWIELRRLSAFQKRRIERHFRLFWLPKLVVSVYSGIWYSLDYTYHSDNSDQPRERFVTFKHNPSHSTKQAFDSNLAKSLWAKRSPNDPKAILRLGERFLKCGLKGGYIVNDCQLPGLELSEDGLMITFDWEETFSVLFREEMLLQKHRHSMLDAAASQWRESNNLPKHIVLPNKVLLKFLCLDIQMASRVAVLRHRMTHHHPQAEPIFDERSKLLHRQTPNQHISESEKGGCFCCNRSSGPDLFEIIQQEESMVLALPAWGKIGHEALFDLYAEEFGWQCCIVCDRIDDTAMQQQRKGFWKGRARTEEQIMRQLMEHSRYDPLG